MNLHIKKAEEKFLLPFYILILSIPDYFYPFPIPKHNYTSKPVILAMLKNLYFK